MHGRVSDHPETVTMKRHPGNSGHTWITSQGEIHGVNLTTLDAYCEQAGLDRLDAIVLDVEGYEERVLLGAERTLSQLKPVVLVELFCPVMAQQGSSPDAVVQVLTRHGIICLLHRAPRATGTVDSLAHGRCWLRMHSLFTARNFPRGSGIRPRKVGHQPEAP